MPGAQWVPNPESPGQIWTGRVPVCAGALTLHRASPGPHTSLPCVTVHFSPLASQLGRPAPLASGSACSLIRPPGSGRALGTRGEADRAPAHRDCGRVGETVRERELEPGVSLHCQLGRSIPMSLRGGFPAQGLSGEDQERHSSQRNSLGRGSGARECVMCSGIHESSDVVRARGTEGGGWNGRESGLHRRGIKCQGR